MFTTPCPEIPEARAERAEALAEQLQARMEELSEQVAVLSRMLFGRSSEKQDPDPSAGAGEGADQQVPDGGRPGKGGQRPGSVGHGRRDYSHLDTREEIHDVPDAERVCAGCGTLHDTTVTALRTTPSGATSSALARHTPFSCSQPAAGAVLTAHDGQHPGGQVDRI
jgi:Transposase C of IS166 homeodomain